MGSLEYKTLLFKTIKMKFNSIGDIKNIVYISPNGKKYKLDKNYNFTILKKYE